MFFNVMFGQKSDIKNKTKAFLTKTSRKQKAPSVCGTPKGLGPAKTETPGYFSS
jgi:hypothetical protein